MKRLYSGVLVIGIIAISGGVYVVAAHTASNFFGTKKPAEAATNIVNCTKTGPTHTITIAQNAMEPSYVSATACDKLTIVNTDNTRREIAFGEHDHHQAYDGITEKELTQRQSLTVTLDEIGNYTFHDHLHDELVGTVTVTR
jgi:plastocyanin